MKAVTPQQLVNPPLEPHMLFICPECGEEHSTQQGWRQHLNDFHRYDRKSHEDFDFKEVSARYHECLICHKWVANAHTSIALLQYHRFLHLPYSRTYRCRHCPGAFTRKRALCEHLHRFHTRQIVRWMKLSQAERIVDTNSVKNPSENPEFYMRFICPQCGKQLDRYQHWLQHLDAAHVATSKELRVRRISGTHKYSCTVCKSVFPNASKKLLQRHCFTHMAHKAYFKCAYCSLKKNYKSEVMLHFLHIHLHERAEARRHLSKPVEWCGSPNVRIVNELDRVLGEISRADGSDSDSGEVDSGEVDSGVDASSETPQQTDLIQKALLDSFIDLEMEAKMHDAAKQPENKSANEYALDQSLNDLVAILRDDLQEQQQQQQQQQRLNVRGSVDSELEELCLQMFDEIGPMTSSQPDDLVKAEIKDEIDDETASDEEQIISIEINAVDDGSNEASFQLPQPKRLKLDEHVTKSHVTDEMKPLLEAHIVYLCPSCGQQFAKQSGWRRHVFKAHNIANALQEHFKPLDSSSYLCLECMDVLNTTEQALLQRHHFMHMPFQSYLKCTLCVQTKSSKPKMLQHLQTHHIEELKRMQNKTKSPCQSSYSCHQCGKPFHTHGRWQHHEKYCKQRHSTSTATATAAPPTRLYNIAENSKLLQHLKKASARIHKIRVAEKMI